VLLSNITFFVIFAVLDVSFAVNSCLNRSFLHLYLQFYYISVAVNWYRVRGTEYVIPTILGAPVAQPAKFGTKVVTLAYSINRSCVPILKFPSLTIAERSRSPNFFLMLPSPDPASFCPISCFLVSYSPSPTCVPNLKLLASTVAEINRGSQMFWMLPQPGPPPIFVVKVVSWQALPPSPSCIPNLKLPASTVAEINRGS